MTTPYCLLKYKQSYAFTQVDGSLLKFTYFLPSFLPVYTALAFSSPAFFRYYDFFMSPISVFLFAILIAFLVVVKMSLTFLYTTKYIASLTK